MPLFRSIERRHASLKMGRAESPIEQTPAARGISSRFRDADKQKAGRCDPNPTTHGGWRPNARSSRRAADEKDEREFYVRMRDSWITVANRHEFLDGIDEQGAPAERPRSAAGQYIHQPVSRSLERRRGSASRQGR